MRFDALGEGDNRAFAYAVAASILIHAVLLLAFPSLRPGPSKSSVAPGPIVARLAPARPAASPPAPPPEEAPKPKVEEPPPPPKAERPVAPTPVAKPAPAPKAAASAPSPVKPAPSAPAEAAKPAEPAPAPSTPVAKVEPQAPSAAPEAPRSTEDSATLEQYRFAIITAAKRYKRYPRVAMDNSWEGTAVVRMVIGADGMIASLSVKTASGHEILDQQALDMIRKAKPLTPIPSALRGKSFAVEVPVIFNLKEGGASG